MRARVIKPFEQEQFDNTAINLCLMMIVAHEYWGFGKKRCLQLIDGFYQARNQYNEWCKEGKFSADAQLNGEMRKFFPDWKNIFQHEIGK